jgi:hypothetical protein
MESARELSSSRLDAALPYSVDRHAAAIPETVLLQVDATVSRVDGLSWLLARRGSAARAEMAELQRRSAAHGENAADLALARLRVLRPRRAEVNELGAAYAASLAPGAIETVATLRRAGVGVLLVSDVAAEALFGVAAALGVGPDELHAPHLRFDAIGAFLGCAAPASDRATRTGGSGVAMRTRWLVGTHRPATFASRPADAFVTFTGSVAREGGADGLATVSSFSELAALLLR